MKSILLSGAAALILTVSGACAAQQDDQHHADTHAGADTHGTPAGADTHMSGAADNHGSTDNANHSGTSTTRHTTHRTRHRHNTTSGTTGTNHAGNDNHAGGNDNAAHNDNARDNNAHHATIDVRFRIAVTATHHFHAGDYRAPPGYVYRRYNVGERLEPAFFVRDYWLTDYATYQLMAPPDGYVWVRFGPDAILIDETTGETVQVQYGIFD
jgi:Ni/Co efflux regulator RcnB